MITCSNCGYENNMDDALACGLCGKVFRKEGRKIDEQPVSKVKKFYGEMEEGWKEEAKDPYGVKGISRAIGEAWRYKGREKIIRIFIFCSFVIGFIVETILEHEFPGLKKTLAVPGGYSPYEGFLIILFSLFAFVLLSKVYDGICWLFNKISKMKRGEGI